MNWISLIPALCQIKFQLKLYQEEESDSVLKQMVDGTLSSVVLMIKNNTHGPKKMVVILVIMKLIPQALGRSSWIWKLWMVQQTEPLCKKWIQFLPIVNSMVIVLPKLPKISGWIISKDITMETEYQWEFGSIVSPLKTQIKSKEWETLLLKFRQIIQMLILYTLLKLLIIKLFNHQDPNGTASSRINTQIWIRDWLEQITKTYFWIDLNFKLSLFIE